jgi:SAM-dependent methyltransferase
MEATGRKKTVVMPSIEWNRGWQRDFQEFREKHPDEVYGIQWGDPEVRGIRYRLRRLLHPSYGPGPLYKVVDRYIRPYVKASSTVLEIGPGGGRWTRYLIPAERIICVEISSEFFDVLRATFPGARLEFYQTQGYELAGIIDSSVDFVFTFGTFVHTEPEEISQYMVHIRRVLKPGGIAVLQYSDKHKPAARNNSAFSNMTAEQMETMASMPIIAHDKRMLKHSNIVVLEKEGGRLEHHGHAAETWWRK